VAWNAGAERLPGYRAEAIIGESFARFFTPEDQAAGLTNYELRTARERGLAEDQNWLVRQDGTRLSASGQTTPLYDTQGTLLGFAKLCRDRTQHRRRDEAMRAEEALLRTVLEALLLGVWIIDRTGQIVHGNAAAHEIWAGLRYARLDQFSEYKGWAVSTGKALNADEWPSARAITRARCPWPKSWRLRRSTGRAS
jgi:PAS domain S-box-containing protein